MRTGYRGIALLEAAMCAALLGSVLLGGLALWQYTDVRSQIAAEAERQLADIETTAALRAKFGSAPKIEVDRDIIRIQLTGALEAAKTTLRKRLNYWAGAANSAFYVQTCFSVFSIDSRTGGLKNHQDECPRESGNRTLTDGQRSLLSLIQERAVPADGYQKLSPVAHPNGGANYLPFSVVIGLRVAVPVQGALVRFASILFKDTPSIVHDEIVMLRGDIG